MDTLSYNHIDTTVLIPLKEFSPHIFLGKSDHTVESLLYIVGFFIVFAVIRLRGKDLLATWLSAFFLKKRVEIIQNDGIIPNLFYYLLALGLSCSIFAIGITFYQVHNLELKSILLIMGSLLAWHFSSLFIVSVTGWTFGSKNIAEEGGVNIWIYNIMMGLLISPLAFALFFVKDFAIHSVLNILIICLILFYLFKLLRWVQIFLFNKVSIFYMILYLCLLEILPMLALYKVLGQ